MGLIIQSPKNFLFPSPFSAQAHKERKSSLCGANSFLPSGLPCKLSYFHAIIPSRSLSSSPSLPLGRTQTNTHTLHSKILSRNSLHFSPNSRDLREFQRDSSTKFIIQGKLMYDPCFNSLLFIKNHLLIHSNS